MSMQGVNDEEKIELTKLEAKQLRARSMRLLGSLVRPVRKRLALSFSTVILSQALHHAEDPSKALQAAARILRPGGRVMILDLVKHRFVQARELYGDRWLGFAESDLHRWVEAAGFTAIEITKVAREEQEPCLETLLAVGTR